MNTDLIQLFADVVQHRSVSRAAEGHGISQSAASQRLKELERQVGQPLLDRSVRPLELTEAGEVFYEGCLDLLRRYDQLCRRLARRAAILEGGVRIDAIYSAGIALLNDVKDRFRQRYPGVQVVIEFKHPQEVHEQLREHRCDLGILSYPQNWPGVGFASLHDEPMVLICTPAHVLAENPSVHVRELDEMPLVGFEAHLPVARHIRRHLRDHGVQPRWTAAFDNIDTIKTAAAATGQAAIVPRPTVEREAAAGVFRIVELTPAFARPMGVLYRRSASGQMDLSPAAAAMVDFLLEHAGPGGGSFLQSMKDSRQLVGGQI